MKLGANLIIGGALFALAIAVGLLAPWLAHTDPVMDANLLNAEEPPSWIWWFGTDGQGRDIYSRVLYGARVSLTVGIVSQLVNSVIGVTLGWFVHRGFFGLSAFVGAGLVFAGLTDFCGMGLLLAKMPWNKHT